ncbi:MAG: hypothetical protein K5679_10925 [Lachnospiraceae bacterium]|nr:hypothetical protein [Lachnospiraceae bacterium]
MRSKLIKLVSIAAVMILAISLSACGKKEEKVKEPIDGAGEGYEFVAKSRSISDVIGTEGYVEKAIAKNGKLYVVHNTGGAQKLHVIDLETLADDPIELDFKSILPETESSLSESEPVNEEPAESDTSADETPATDTEVTTGDVSEGETDGTLTVVEEEGRGDLLDGDMSDTYMYEEVGDGGADVSDLVVNDDDSILFLLATYTETGRSYNVCKRDSNGSLSLVYSADGLVKEGEYVSRAYLKEDGGIYLTKESSILSVDKDGKKEGEIEVGNWIQSIFTDKEGNCYVTFWSQAESGIVCKKADFAQNTLSDGLKVAANNGRTYQTGEDTYVVAGSDAVTEYNVKTDEKKKLWDWINLDLFNVDTESFMVNDDGSYSFIAANYDDEATTYDYVTVSKEKIDPANAKIELVYGCSYLDWNVRTKISAFNKSQDKYRIRVKQYIDYDGDYDENSYTEQYARFKADLAAGNVFDLVSVDATDAIALKLAQKGAFLDLSDFYKETINRSDYFENILDIFQVNGKDYFALSHVSLLAMIGNGEIFKGKTTITPQEIVELRKQYSDIPFLTSGTKESALYTMVVYSLNTFVDYEKGTCDFCNQNFYDLLNFADTFPKEINNENYDTYGMMANGDIILSELYLYDLSSLRMYRQIMGDDAVIVGPPNDKGIRVQVIPNAMYAISAKTTEKEGCFEFLKFYMEDQSNKMYSSSGIPVRKQAFYDMIEDEITPDTYTDENGNVVEEDTSYTIGTDYGMIDVGIPTQAEADILEGLMNEAKDTIRLDEKFTEIFMEEVQPFIEGQKTAEETATVLQSRVKIYLSENE